MLGHPYGAGGQEHVLQLTKNLRDKYRCQVDIVAPTIVRKDFDFHNFSQRIWFTSWVLQFILTSDYEIYHSHTFTTDAFLPLVKLRGKKAVITVHGLGKNLIGGGILNKLGIPKLLMQLILNFWPYDARLSASKIKGFTTVGNGVNVDEYDKIKSQKTKRFRIFWLGRKYDPVKGLKYLQEAVKGLDVDLDIVDSQENPVFGEEKIRRFKMASLYVLPSLSEGLPIVLLEAMAAKLPIITTDVGDCRALVEKAQAGMVIPPGDVSVLVRAVSKMMTDPNRNKLGQNGYNFVKDNYTWEKVASHVYETYQKVLN